MATTSQPPALDETTRRTNPMKKLITYVALTLAAGLTVAPAHAADRRTPNSSAAFQDGRVAPSVRVPIGDLDLGSEEGRASLKRRLSHAVDKVCDRAGQPEGLQRLSYVHCVRDSWMDALAQLDGAVDVAQLPQANTPM